MITCTRRAGLIAAVIFSAVAGNAHAASELLPGSSPTWQRQRPGAPDNTGTADWAIWTGPVMHRMPVARRGRFEQEVIRAADKAGLDPALVHAVIGVESAYQPDARSSRGAVGLMQVIPATGRRFGVEDLRQPSANLQAGTRYLSHLMRVFDGDLRLVLAAYNAGENAVLRHGRRVPPYPETERYVPRVLNAYHALAKSVRESP